MYFSAPASRALSIAAKSHAEWLYSIPGIIDFIKKPLLC